MELTELDIKIKSAFRRLQNYSAVGRELGIPRARVERRVLTMRAAGIELPPLLRGFASLSPERRRELGAKGAETQRKAKNA